MLKSGIYFHDVGWQRRYPLGGVKVLLALVLYLEDRIWVQEVGIVHTALPPSVDSEAVHTPTFWEKEGQSCGTSHIADLLI